MSEDSPHPRLYLLARILNAKEVELIFGAIMKSKVRNTSVQVRHPPSPSEYAASLRAQPVFTVLQLLLQQM